MAKKEFKYKGKTVEELKKLDISLFMDLVPSRIRRNIKRGFTDEQKILLTNIRKGQKNIKTHCRDMIILPEMIGITIGVYDGKTFVPVAVNEEMMGHVIGEFAPTRRKVAHSSPGIGATKSSTAVSVK